MNISKPISKPIIKGRICISADPNSFPTYFFPMTVCFPITKDTVTVYSKEELEFICTTERGEFVIVSIEKLENRQSRATRRSMK